MILMLRFSLTKGAWAVAFQKFGWRRKRMQARQRQSRRTVLLMMINAGCHECCFYTDGDAPADATVAACFAACRLCFLEAPEHVHRHDVTGGVGGVPTTPSEPQRAASGHVDAMETLELCALMRSGGQSPWRLPCGARDGVLRGKRQLLLLAHAAAACVQQRFKSW